MARVTAENRFGLSGKMEGMAYVQLNGQTYTRKAPRFRKKPMTPACAATSCALNESTSFVPLLKIR